MYMERVERIELSHNPWQGPRLPLHHTRDVLFNIVFGVGDRNRTCITLGCNQPPSLSGHTYVNWRLSRESDPGPQFWRLMCYRNT